MRKYISPKTDNYRQTVMIRKWWKNKTIKDIFSYFLSFINNNWETFIDSNLKSFFLICIHGFILGLFIQTLIATNLQDIFYSFRLFFIILFSIVIFLILWVAYAFFLMRVSVKSPSRGIFYEILLYDSLSYMPFSVSLSIGMLLFYTNISINIISLFVLSGLFLTFISKIIIYLFKPPDKNIPLKEKAQQVKMNLIKKLNDLEPDETYVRMFDSKYPIRKFMVADELRNAINLKNLKTGKIKIKNQKSLKTLRFSIGWSSEKKLSRGNIKLFLNNGKSDEMILNKDATNLIDGWNEYQMSIPNDANSHEIKWKNSIKDDIYFSIAEITSSEEHKKENIVVIVFDGVVPESIGLYTDKKDADYISKFFKDSSLMFNNAYAQGEWTLPNFVSIATSLYQTHHGVFDPDLYSQDISSSNKTLAEILQENGYNTFGYFSCHRTSPGYGHTRGFNRCIYRFTGHKAQNNHKDIVFSALDFLKKNQQTNNFLFLHIFDTHIPHFQSPGTISSMNEALINKHIDVVRGQINVDKDDLSYLQELYLQKYKEIDDDFSILFDYISKYENDCTTVIFTADHGVLLFDKEMKNVIAAGEKGGRKNYLLESILKVPFLVRLPKKENQIYEVKNDFIEANLTIMPTVLDIAGIKPVKDIDGVSIFSNNNSNEVGKGYAIAESNYKNRYELLLKSSSFKYFLKTEKDRVNSEILKNANKEEIFFNLNNEPILDKKSINDLKIKVSKIVEDNKLPNVVTNEENELNN